MKSTRIAEYGVAVKGWGLDPESAHKRACYEFNRYEVECDHSDQPCMFIDRMGIAEVWIRRRPALPNEGLDFDYIMDYAKPGSPWAGKWTVFYYDHNNYEVERQIRWSPAESV